MIIKENLAEQIALLVKTQANYQQRLKHLPKGTLSTRHAEGRTYYYNIGLDKTKTSLQSNSEMREKVLLREEYRSILAKIKSNLVILRKCYEEYMSCLTWNESLTSLAPRTESLYDDDLKQVINGMKVRSKAEGIVAEILDSLGLEYIYEPCVYINGRYFYPDFAIKRPYDGRIIYLEHCGIIGSESYESGISKKIEAYRSVGITLWDNLILTFSTSDNRMNIDNIRRTIELFLIEKPSDRI